jgi:hypothetical protein
MDTEFMTTSSDESLMRHKAAGTLEKVQIVGDTRTRRKITGKTACKSVGKVQYQQKARVVCGHESKWEIPVEKKSKIWRRLRASRIRVPGVFLPIIISAWTNDRRVDLS